MKFNREFELLRLGRAQMRIIPVSTAFEAYAHEQAAKLKAAGLRVEVCSDEKVANHDTNII